MRRRRPCTVRRALRWAIETSGQGESVATSTSPEVFSMIKPTRRQQRSWSLQLEAASARAAQSMLDGVLMRYFAWEDEDTRAAFGDVDALAYRISVLWYRLLYR